MNDHTEKLKKRIEICKNEENICKQIVESARSRHKIAIQNLEREKTNLHNANVKLNKMMDSLKPSPKKDKLQSPTSKQFRAFKDHIKHLKKKVASLKVEDKKCFQDVNSAIHMHEVSKKQLEVEELNLEICAEVHPSSVQPPKRQKTHNNPYSTPVKGTVSNATTKTPEQEFNDAVEDKEFDVAAAQLDMNEFVVEDGKTKSTKSENENAE